VQPWHFDDGAAKVPRPRPALGVSAFWAIDDTTELNGSTEVIPGSHLWDEQIVEGATRPADFTSKTTPNTDRDPGNRPDAVKMMMPSGSLAVAKGTLWHRGGANLSDRPRLIITPLYCAAGAAARGHELGGSRRTGEKLPERARELIGYSIHPPFMGHVAFTPSDRCRRRPCDAEEKRFAQ
jgi:ectoine hydroxylase-related dioxygenase (phytanoyl-CoA dioxygenase family)